MTARRPALMIVVVAAIVVIAAMLTNVVPFRQVVAQSTEIAAAKSELAGIVAENARLSQQVAALDTPIEIERIARDKLGYVRPGEMAYVVIEPEEPEVVHTEEVDVATIPDDTSIFEKLWAYLTGADLVSG